MFDLLLNLKVLVQLPTLYYMLDKKLCMHAYVFIWDRGLGSSG